MSQQIINTGLADKGNGDPLRTAFTKVNANFTELFNHTSAGVVAGDTAPETPGEGDLWWDSVSGRMYVYYGSSWVDASPVDGVGSSSTNELVNGAHTVSLSSVGLTAFPAISNESLFIQASELGSANASIGISAKNSVIVTANILDTAKQWIFGTSGTLTVPHIFPKTFTATVDDAHYDGTLVLTGDAWSFDVTFAIGADGAIETQISNSTPWPSNPGYTNGMEFAFIEADHGIPGYTFTLTLVDIQNPGPMMYTTNLAASIPPTLPATIISSETVKITADATSWLFTPNGNLKLPAGGDILDSTGASVLGGGGSETYFGTINRTDVVISKYLITSVDTGSNTFVVAGNAVSDTFAYQINIDTQSITYTLAKLQPATHLNGETTVYIDDIDDTVNPAWVGHYMRCVTRNLQPTNIGFSEAFTLSENNVVGLKPLNTGNIGFVTDYIYDFNGVTLENADLTHGATAAVIVPANGNTSNPIHLNNLYGDVRVSSGIAGATKSWDFGGDGSLTFPSGAGFSNGESGQLKVNDGTTLSLDIRDQSGRGFYTNSDGYTLRSNGTYNWKFGTDGKLTTPNNVELKASTTTGSYEDALSTWAQVKAEAQAAIDNNQTTIEGWPFAGWNVTGANAASYLTIVQDAWIAQNTPDATLIFTPAISHSFYTQMRSSILLIQSTYTDINKGLDIVAGTATWSLGPDSRLRFPAGNEVSERNGRLTIDGTNGDGYVQIDGTQSILVGSNSTANVAIGNSQDPNSLVDILSHRFRILNANVPAHSYGVPGDMPGLVAFDGDYIYYCKQQYVNNTTDIWVRVAWTGTSW